MIKNKEYLEDYLKQHPVKIRAAAYISYYVNCSPKMLSMMEDYKTNHTHNDDEQRALEEEIVKTEDQDQLMRYMRKPMDAINKDFLRDLILEREDEMMPLVQKRYMSSHQDVFIENAFALFVRSEKDYLPWIKENYNKIADPYAKHLLCLLMGIKGADEEVDFLLEEVDNFYHDTSKESLEQGPIVALHLLVGEDILQLMETE